MQIISGILLLHQFQEDVMDLLDYQMNTKETFMTDFLRVVERVQVHIAKSLSFHTKKTIDSISFLTTCHSIQ